MKFNKVVEVVKDTPYITPNNAKDLYNFIIESKCSNILELGFAHGTATCYMAAALDEMGEGKINCVDLINAEQNFNPSLETQIESCGLEKYVEVHRMKSGYNWFLHNEIENSSKNEAKICQTKYDLIIIDGPKNWTIDSSSFFLCDKLLKQNGWIIWDDYSWTYAQANVRRDSTDGIKHNSMDLVEQKTPHIKDVFHLLVMQHPNYSNFIIKKEGDWAWAQKIKSDVKKIKFYSEKSTAVVLLDLFHKLARKTKSLVSRKLF